jgi:pantetheine-phosphate adenylyltransferase
MRSAFYPGSFDPPTLGHRDIIRRGLELFDRVIVGIGVHPSKTPMFSDAERLEMLAEELTSLGASGRGEARLFKGLTVEAARKFEARWILRGLRDSADFSYEMQLAGMNGQMAPEVETVFLAASPGTAHIASTLIRQISSLGGDVSPFVSPGVLRRIQNKLALSPN